MADDKTRLKPLGSPAPAPKESVAAFLAEVKARPPMETTGRGRLIFGLDATLSRQPAWDLACALQAEMFEAAAAVGGLEVQLVYYRGFNECRASGWAADARRLAGVMSRIEVEGGRTQIGRVLRHAANESAKARVNALVFVGDATEEALDELCTDAGALGLRGVPAFMFQEGRDAAAERAFREIARLTKGAWCRFDAGAAAELRALLRAVAAYAAGGQKALAALSRSEAGTGAQRLIAAMRGGA